METTIQQPGKRFTNAVQVDDRGPGGRDARLFRLLAADAPNRSALPDADRGNDAGQLAAFGTDSPRQHQHYSFGYFHLPGAAGIRRLRRYPLLALVDGLFGALQISRLASKTIVLFNCGMMVCSTFITVVVVQFLSWTSRRVEISWMVNLYCRCRHDGAGSVLLEYRHQRNRFGFQNRSIHLAHLAERIISGPQSPIWRARQSQRWLRIRLRERA